MESSKKALISDLIDSLINSAPETISEYISVVGGAVGRIAGDFGIEKVVYIIEPPKEDLVEFRLPKRVVLYGEDKENSGSPLLYRYHFASSGMVTFEVCPSDKGTPELYRDELSGLFRLLHHLLNAILFDSLYSRLTTHDLLTGMLNTSGFLMFCEKLRGSGRLSDYTALSFNIRNFKSVHNSLTYLEGREVIRTYCRIVTGAVTEDEIVAHTGGDNFVALVLSENIDYFLDLIGNMVVRYQKGDKLLTFSFGATIGALDLSGGENDPGEIMMHVSAAYQSAREKRTLICYYDKKAELDLLAQKTILSKFPQAMLTKEFKVFYQPKVSVKDKTLCGAEALVRWFRPDGSMVMPGSFIPVIEKDGCICALDFYVMEEVCRFQRKLLDAGTEPVKISVNFSKRHLSDNKFVEEIAGMADAYNIPHEYIEAELTESEDFHNNSIMRDVVDELDALGIKTSIDDFGTGYSSLGMLCALSLDTLKIDRSFIPAKGSGDYEKRMFMLNSVVGLAKNLGLTTVAEGVETPDQLEILENMGCDIIQGYIFDRPLPEDEFMKRIRQRVYTVEK